MSDMAGSSFDEAKGSRSDKHVTVAAKIRRFTTWQAMGPFFIFAAMLVTISLIRPGFLGGGGFSIVTTSAAPIMLIAIGQSMVLNIGSIDLSNAAISLLGAILLALALAPLAAIAPIAVLFVVTLFGAINGVLVAYAQAPSLALTLGTLSIFKAAAFVTSGDETIYVTQNRELITVFFQYRLAGPPLIFWIGVVVAVLAWLLLRFTGVGQGMTAIGKNESGAIFSAVGTRRLKILAFAISGFTAGLASISVVAQAGSASASGVGSNLLLPGIAAALIGGTSISGGVTNPINVVFGALAVAFVPIAVVAIGVTAEAQSLVYGFVIIAVVALTTSRPFDMIIK